MVADRACEAGGRFSRCRRAAVDTCQYCGRRFCEAHTRLNEGHEAVCSRKSCSKKADDLAAHQSYQAAVDGRNRQGLCGADGCGPDPGFACSLCRGNFCAGHLTVRLYPFREGRAVVERRVSVCNHCWGRRKVWRSS